MRARLGIGTGGLFGRAVLCCVVLCFLALAGVGGALLA